MAGTLGRAVKVNLKHSISLSVLWWPRAKIRNGQKTRIRKTRPRKVAIGQGVRKANIEGSLQRNGWR